MRSPGLRGGIAGLMLLVLGGVSWGEGLPEAQRGEAERYLFLAYDLLVRQRYWESLDALEQALARNTYLVDYYLLRGLVLRRLGFLAEATAAVEHYLEVRPREEIPRRIGASLREERDSVRDLLRGPLGAPSFQFQRSSVEVFFRLPLTMPWNARGIAKARMVGAAQVVADELGNSLTQFFPGTPPSMRIISADAPVTVCPVDLKKFLVLSRPGEVWEGSLDSSDLVPRGTISAIPSNGECGASDLLGVADWGRRRVVFFDSPSLRENWSWAPQGTDPLHPFEPVAVSSLGPLVAVADRGGNRVYVLDIQKRQLEKEFPVPSPRDVLWSRGNALMILSEEGKIFLWTEGEPSLILEGLKDAWALSESIQGLIVWDVAGNVLWNGVEYPPVAGMATMMCLAAPGSVGGENPQAVFRAYVGEPAHSLFPRGRSFVSAVWMGRKMEGTIVPRASGEDRGVLLLGGAGRADETKDLPVAVLQDGAMLLSALRQACKDTGTLPSCLVVDAAIPFSPEDLERLFSMALNNGIRVYALATQIPSAPLARLVRMTGGRVMPTERLDALPFAPKASWEIRVPLPVDALPSGYPSEAMLAVYVDAGSLTLRDWIPYWPVGFDMGAQPLAP